MVLIPLICAVASVSVWWVLIQKPLPRPSHCVSCGYHVGDEEGRVCPECATVVQRSITEKAAKRSWSRRWIALVILLSITGQCISAVASLALPLTQTVIEIPYENVTLRYVDRDSGEERYSFIIEYPAPEIRDTIIDQDTDSVFASITCSFNTEHDGFASGEAVRFPRSDGSDVVIQPHELERWIGDELGLDASQTTSVGIASIVNDLEHGGNGTGAPFSMLDNFRYGVSNKQGQRFYTQPPRWTAGVVFLGALLPLILFIITWWQMSQRRESPLDDRAECAGWYFASLAASAIAGMILLPLSGGGFTLAVSSLFLFWGARLIFERNEVGRNFIVIILGLIVLMLTVGCVVFPFSDQSATEVSFGTATIRSAELVMVLAVGIPLFAAILFPYYLLHGDAAREQFEQWREARAVNRDEEIVEMLMERDRSDQPGGE